MTELQDWMLAQNLKDADLATLSQGSISRSQISRIRRGQSGASPSTAKTLELLTGLPWHSFITAGMQ